METLGAKLPQLPRKVLIPALAKVDERGRASQVISRPDMIDRYGSRSRWHAGRHDEEPFTAALNRAARR
jgi:hypothetical protein